MYYAEYGQGEPLILLHGGLGCSGDFARQVPAFADKYRVITPDSRGKGRSTDSSAPMSYDAMMTDTLKLMDHLKIDKAYIVGWSDGAIVGLDMAIKHPERVKALVSYGANASPDGLVNGFTSWLKNGSAAELQQTLRSDCASLSADKAHWPELVEKHRTMWLKEPNFTKEQLGGIPVPVLILDGENEELIAPGHAAWIAGAIPNARLMLMKNVGHFAPVQRTGEFNRIVLDFLKNK
jgi:pimeloyl-ACP methyl ester carboxylesterase